MIITAGLSKDPAGVDVSFDCGLATENMYITAQSLGLGAHIYAAPVSDMNADRELLQIPDGYNAIAAVLIGYVEETEDAASSASVRRGYDDSVTVVE